MRVSLYLTAALAACSRTPGAGDDTAETVCDTDPPTAEVGTGDSGFEPLSDGDEVPLIHGPQGGNHILGAIRLVNMDAVALIHYSLARVTTGELVSDQIYRIQLEAAGPCTFEASNLYGYVGFTGEQDPSQTLLGQEILMRMEASDASGRTAADEVVIVPRPFEDATTQDTGAPPSDTPPA